MILGGFKKSKKLESNAMWDCIDNARDIKNRMLELIASVPGSNVGGSPAINREAEKEAKNKTPLAQHVKKCDQEV